MFGSGGVVGQEKCPISVSVVELDTREHKGRMYFTNQLCEINNTNKNSMEILKDSYVY